MRTGSRDEVNAELGAGRGSGDHGNGQAGDTNSDLYATVGDKVVVQRAMPGREYQNLRASERPISSIDRLWRSLSERFLFSFGQSSLSLAVTRVTCKSLGRRAVSWSRGAQKSV